MIEDQPPDRELIRRSLTKFTDLALDVKEAGSMAEAAESLAKYHFDLILSDLHLPDSDGAETISSLLKLNLKTPIVVLTGTHQDEQMALGLLRRGVQDYLSKDRITPELLERTIRYALERYGREQRELAASEERLQRVIQESSQGMMIVDAEGVVRLVNEAAERLLGKNKKQLLGQVFELPQGTRPISEIEEVNSRREAVWVELRFVPIQWEGVPMNLVCCLDITERRRQDRIKNDFVGAISHELRSPLAALNLAIHQLSTEAAGPLTQKQGEMVQKAQNSIERLGNLVNNLLDFSRLQPGVSKPKLNRSDMGPILQEVVKNFAPRSAARGLAFTSDFPSETLPVFIDPHLIAKVLSHLLENALRHASSLVELRAIQDKGGIQVTVANDGPPIPSWEQSRLFTSFEQIDRPAGGPGYQGVGLGLAIARSIIDQHGGKIWVESVPGQKVRFHFYLPKDTESGELPANHVQPLPSH